LILADDRPLLGSHEDDRVIGGLQRLGETGRDPGPGALAVAWSDPEVLALDAGIELHGVFAGLDTRIRHLPVAARLEIAQERVAHRRAVEARRREPVQQHIALVERAQAVLPPLRDRALLGKQWPRAVLEGNLAQLG